MKNSFNITIDKYTLRSTDDYFVVAEIILHNEETPIVRLYREEQGFSIKFVAKEQFYHNTEEQQIFANLFRILVDIINSYMLEEGISMKFNKESTRDAPVLSHFLQMSGIMPLEENYDEELDFEDPLSYNEDEDDYRYDDRDENDDYGYDDTDDFQHGPDDKH